jgi:hypothetical protein
MANLKKQYDFNPSPSKAKKRNFLPQKTLREQIKEKMKEKGLDKKL